MVSLRFSIFFTLRRVNWNCCVFLFWHGTPSIALFIATTCDSCCNFEMVILHSFCLMFLDIPTVPPVNLHFMHWLPEMNSRLFYLAVSKILFSFISRFVWTGPYSCVIFDQNTIFLHLILILISSDILYHFCVYYLMSPDCCTFRVSFGFKVLV